MRKLPFPFENTMTRRQTLIGLVYFPIHVFVLAFWLPGLLVKFGIEDQATMNLVYYGIGVALSFTAFWSFLRRGFDVLLDRLGHCILSFFMALGLDYVLSYAVGLLMLAIAGGEQNPNDMAISEIALQSGGMVRAVGIFMAPIVEEILFRGVIFGAVREKNRLAAYVITVAMFALYHVWQYALAYGDWGMMVYILQYIPVGIVLCWLFERSGSIWMPIGFHMMINAMSFTVERILSQAA